MQTAQQASAVLRDRADAAIAEHAQRFFKTAPGQYGHGDIFLGLRVPTLRALVKEFAELPRREILTLLRSAITKNASLPSCSWCGSLTAAMKRSARPSIRSI
jgi:hypothetical protein